MRFPAFIESHFCAVKNFPATPAPVSAREVVTCRRGADDTIGGEGKATENRIPSILKTPKPVHGDRSAGALAAAPATAVEVTYAATVVVEAQACVRQKKKKVVKRRGEGDRFVEMPTNGAPPNER